MDDMKLAGTDENRYVLRRRGRVRWEATPYANKRNPRIQIFANHMKPKIYAKMRTPAKGLTECFDMWLEDKEENLPLVSCGIKRRDRRFFQTLLDPKKPVTWEHMDECLWTLRRNHSKYCGTTKTKTVITDSQWFEAFNNTAPDDLDTLIEKTKPYFLGALPVRGSEGRRASRWFMPWKTTGKNSCWILVCVDITDTHGLCAKVYDPRKKEHKGSWNLARLVVDFPKLLKEYHNPPEVEVPVSHKRWLNKVMKYAPLIYLRGVAYSSNRRSTHFLKVLHVMEKMLERNSICGGFDCLDEREIGHRKWYAVEIWRTGFEFVIVDTYGNRISLPGESMEEYLCNT